MNFDYSTDQKFLKAEVRRFLVANSPTDRVRQILQTAAMPYDADLWQKVAAQGWLGTAIPESYGGVGLGHVELCAIAEELGRAVAAIPFSSTVYFLAEAVSLLGTDDQKARFLPGIAAGELIGCVAIAEGPGAALLAPPRAGVAGGSLSGSKLPVTDGLAASCALVLAQEDGRPTLFLAQLDDSVQRTRLDTLDPTRDAARLTFRATPVERLGRVGDGLAAAQAIWDRAAVLLSFEQCGGADKCLEMARDYALSRFAFGRPIASYQAIKHKLADIYVKNELARSNAYYGAWALNSSAPELPVAASAARIAGSDAYWFAAKENIQVHGGIGFTWELDAHLYYRRSRQLALMAGSPSQWKERLIAELERRPMAA